MEFTVEDLTPNTDYHCYFISCGDYPLWPLCNEDSTSIEILVVEVTTAEEEITTSIEGSILMEVVYVLILVNF